MKKRMISLLLVVALVFCCTEASFASEPCRIPSTVSIDDARLVAYNFIIETLENSVNVEDLLWCYGMRFGNEDILYDFSENVSAYTFHFKGVNDVNLGYITVSASTSSIPIIEYSYSATPVYQSLKVDADRVVSEQSRYKQSKILYTGGIDYFIEYELEDDSKVVVDILSKHPHVLDEEEKRIEKENAKNNYGTDARNTHLIELEWKNLLDLEDRSSNPPTSGSVITNPYSYESGYVSTNTNTLSYTSSAYTYFATYDFTSPCQACSPTAAMNLFKWYTYYNSTLYSNLIISGSWSASYAAMFAYMGTDNTGFTLHSNVIPAFVNYLNAVSVSYSAAYYMGPITYGTISGMNKPIFVSINGHYLYGDHDVVAMGFVRFNYSDGSDSLYLRIADGWSGTATRYVHTTVGSSYTVSGYKITLS